MQTPQLRQSQQRILESLVELVDDEARVVSGEEIAAEIDRTPGAIRNQMQSLRALQLVEGIPGPKGGYKPTAAAYRTLDSTQIEDPATVPVEGDGPPVDSVTIEKIDFEAVHNPDLCRAAVTVHSSTDAFSDGDVVTIGPTPSTGLQITGTVEAIDRDTDTITLDINRMRTPTEAVAAD